MAARLAPLKSFKLVILLSVDTMVACKILGVTIAMVLTGICLSSSEVKGKLPLLATWKLFETSTSLMAGPEPNACHLASMPRLASKPCLSITMLMLFWPDQGAWNATCSGHQPFCFSHSTDLSETFS